MSSKGELREKTKLFPMMFSIFHIIVTLYVQSPARAEKMTSAIIQINEM